VYTVANSGGEIQIFWSSKYVWDKFLTEEPSAYFLIAHGSRDLRSHQGLETCAALVRQHLAAQPSLGHSIPRVGTGVLEFGDRPLAIQIADFARIAAISGVRQIFLLPLFLTAGNHVLQDLPEAIDRAQSQITADITLTLCPILGTYPHVSQLVQARMEEVLPCDRWILLAHGTRRAEGNQPIESLAAELGIVPVCWAIAPTLEEPIQTLQRLGAQRIGVVPYFLFAGRITDTIEAHVVELKSKFTDLELPLTQPLNPSPLLAKLLVDCCAARSDLPQ
jgi:sirohydrochlorin cobaltochelatase